MKNKKEKKRVILIKIAENESELFILRSNIIIFFFSQLISLTCDLLVKIKLRMQILQTDINNLMQEFLIFLINLFLKTLQ